LRQAEKGKSGDVLELTSLLLITRAAAPDAVGGACLLFEN